MMSAKIREERGRSRGNRVVIVLGVVLLYFLQSEIRFLPSPLMKELAEDFGVPLTMVGNMLSVCMVAAAVSMFGTSVIVEKIGSVNLLIAGCFSVAFTGLLTGFSGSFPAAVFAYLFCGVCQGILECIGVVLVAELFTPRYRAFFCSGICAVAQISSSVAYSLPVFLVKRTGSWRSLELLWGILAMAVGLVIFFFGGREAVRRRNSPEKKGEKKEKPGLIRALQIRFILLSVLTMVVFIWVNNHYSIYLPTYLAETKGFTPEQAGLAASVMYIGGFSGAMAAAALSVKFRKQIYRFAPVFMLIGGISLCFWKTVPGVLFSAALFAFAYQMWVPMALSSFMNLEGVTTGILAGATALFNGAGHFLTGFIPTVFTFELRFVDMNTAYLCTAALLIIPVFLTMAASCRKEFR
ncbi:MAG: MFS transporter [Candidatus Limivivens sp.]|nr:MFS transporter [Candidatus Limivivens sp.]